jgi:hypothetical protein
MPLLPNSMIDILASGGGLVVNATALLPNTLVQMAAAAQEGNSTLIVRNCGALLPNTMAQIAAAGGGHVIFDVSE